MAKTKVYFWLKVDKKFFDNIFIKKLKNIAGGYTMTVIYIRLMLESLESDCVLYYEGYFNDLAEELALKLDVSEDDIRMTLSYFTQCGLIQVDSDSNAEMPQAKALVQQETNQAAYMRQYRKEQKEKKNNLTMLSENLTTLTTCKTKIEIEIEKELEIDIEAEVEAEKEKKNEIPTTTPLSEFNQLILENFGKHPSPLQVDEMRYLVEEHKMEVLRLAVKEAVDNGKPYFAYLNGILNHWKHDGLTTAELVRNRVKPRNKSGKVTMLDDGYDPKLGI